MSDQDKEEIRQDIRNDLGKMHVKMSLQILIGIVLGTVSICGTILGTLYHLEGRINDNENKIVNLQQGVIDCKTDNHALWGECGNLQTQINNNVQNRKP